MPAPPEPFTVEHFRRYCRLLVLDNGEQWELEDFQAAIVEDVFAGAQEVWALIPEGNAKTTLLAGVALYHADYTPSANALVAASSREQAGLLFGQAAGFVYRTPGMKDRFRVFEGYRRIQAHRTHGRIQVFAADDRTGDGAIPTFAIVDELHRHRDMRLYRTWRGKLDKRGGQLVAISTAGEPGSEFEIARERMRLAAADVVRVGCHTRAASQDVVLHEWALKPGEDIEDLDLVKQANPLEAVTVEMLRRRRESPSMTVAHWSRFVCNIAAAEQGAWLEDASGWHKAAAPRRRPDPGMPVIIGIDPARTFDTFSIVGLQPTGDREAFAWPLAILRPEREDGGVVPLWKVRQVLEKALHDYRVLSIGYDRGSGLDLLVEEMHSEVDAPFVNVDMGPTTWVPLTAELRAAITREAVSHPDDETFTAHVLAGETKDSPHGHRLHGRTRSKVDALIALGIAWRLAFGQAHHESMYESETAIV